MFEIKYSFEELRRSYNFGIKGIINCYCFSFSLFSEGIFTFGGSVLDGIGIGIIANSNLLS
jgi:hypothetical protein